MGRQGYSISEFASAVHGRDLQIAELREINAQMLEALKDAQRQLKALDMNGKWARTPEAERIRTAIAAAEPEADKP